MSKLAIKGGQKVRKNKFPAHHTIGIEEETAAKKVIDSGVLSRFLGTWHEDFYGGPEVRALEMEWARYFGVKHVISVNSATSALYCAVGAIGVGPGDEVIVSPYTMSASAVAPLIYNAIPVFADIEEDFFCLSARSIEEKITSRTKAIIVVDIFGQPYDADTINALAKKHNLKVIEDCAQAPGAFYKDKFAGTLGDIGIYSLNYHKHIHSGEGGIIATDNDDLADKITLIRNHAEAVVDAKGVNDIVNLLGFNFRMTEIEASIVREQLKKLKGLLEIRVENIDYLNKGFAQIPCIEVPKIRSGATHAYYLHALKFDPEIAGIHRDVFIDAVKAELSTTELRETEGVKVGSGYVKPLYLQSIFQKRIAYGNQGCPWKCDKYTGNPDYSQGGCPVVEKMHYDVLFTHELMKPGMEKNDLDDVIKAFKKVSENIQELK